MYQFKHQRNMNNYWDITGEEGQLPLLPEEIIIESELPSKYWI